jgi:hypothetical protein
VTPWGRRPSRSHAPEGVNDAYAIAMRNGDGDRMRAYAASIMVRDVREAQGTHAAAEHEGHGQ